MAAGRASRRLDTGGSRDTEQRARPGRAPAPGLRGTRDARSLRCPAGLGRVACCSDPDWLGHRPGPDPGGRGSGSTPDDLEEWHRDRFGAEPDYSRLLDTLTSRPADRAALLRRYFEPGPLEEGAEPEAGYRVPTIAHHAIAELVELGVVRMIVTTNFDRLMEQALNARGIVPTVVDSDDALRGAEPYVHARCWVVKLHGDYLDGRIKNTATELASYSRAMNQLLDRVFDDFGLIVCGWSATWDTALRRAMLRAKGRRYGWFWFATGGLSADAQRLVAHRRAEVVPIRGADEAFTRLAEQVRSLLESDRPDPETTAAVVATVKRYIPDDRYRVRLHDLVHEETERAHAARLVGFEMQPAEAVDTVPLQLRRYEALSERPIAILAALGYHGSPHHSPLIVRGIELLAPRARAGGYVDFIQLQLYPAILLTYAAGIAALAAGRFEHLVAALTRPRTPDLHGGRPSFLLGEVYARGEYVWNLRPYLPVENAARKHTPFHDHLQAVLQSPLAAYLPAEAAYQDAFDVFEFLTAMVVWDTPEPDGRARGWAPFGCFTWRYRRASAANPIDEFVSEVAAAGADAAILRAGFMSGDPERFRRVASEVAAWHAQHPL